jgi:hypothetical protein
MRSPMDAIEIDCSGGTSAAMPRLLARKQSA